MAMCGYFASTRPITWPPFYPSKHAILSSAPDLIWLQPGLARQGRNMQQKPTLLGKRIMRPTILATAIAVAISTASMSVLAEPAAPARKLTYQDYRRGLFALSKIESASIVMLGDSLTEGAPWRELTGCLSLVNRGIGGDTTTRLRGRLDEVLKLKPRAIFLMIGVNDISLSVPRSTSVENLRAILDRLE